jgi:hypothetical protein
VDQALVLVQRHHFAKGQLYLYEKRKYYHMIIQHYMDLGDHRSILSTGRKYGTTTATCTAATALPHILDPPLTFLNLSQLHSIAL